MAGVQLGDRCWKTIRSEHGIQPTGLMPLDRDPGSESDLFNEKSGKQCARAIFVDTIPTAIDSVRIGPQRALFEPDSMITGNADTGMNYSRGYNQVGPEIFGRVCDQIRRMAEESSGLQGFNIYHSVGGGTGSGLTALVLENLANEYADKVKVTFSVYPGSRYSESVMEPFNTMFITEKLLSYANVVFPFENGAVSNILRSKLNRPNAHFNSGLNEAIAAVVSGITAPLRHGCDLYRNLEELSTSLVATPRNQFVLTSYAPFLRREAVAQTAMTTRDLTSAVFESGSVLADVELGQGMYQAIEMIYRGRVHLKDMMASIQNLKMTNQDIVFAQWLTTGFKTGIVEQLRGEAQGDVLGRADRSVLMMGNTSAFVQVADRINRKVEQLWKQRSYVHWYSNCGTMEEDFGIARECLNELGVSYNNPPGQE